MKSNIVFFDSTKNSMRGTFRGMVIFPVFIIISIIYFYLMKNVYKKHMDKVETSRIIFSFMISGLLIVSALGVHNPDTAKKAIVYGGLVGMVIYGIANVSLLSTSNKWTYMMGFIDTLWGIISTSFLGYLLFLIVQKWPEIFAPV